MFFFSVSCFLFFHTHVRMTFFGEHFGGFLDLEWPTVIPQTFRVSWERWWRHFLLSNMRECELG